MRRNLVLLSLVLLFGVGTASATTPTFNVFTATPNLANIGLSEVLGQVAITADASCGTNADGLCLTADGNIVLTFSMVLIDNSVATGIETIVSPVACAPVVGTTVANVDTNGDGMADSGRVSVQLLNPGPPVDLASGCQILVRGVRARIATSFAATPGSTVFVQLTTSPSGIAAFTPTTAPVGSSAIFRTFTNTPGQVLLCIGTLAPVPSITVTEGYNDAFFDAVPGAFPRIPAAGANANTQVLVTLTGLPAGVTVNWGTPGVTSFPPGFPAGLDALVLTAQSASGNAVIFTFETNDQGVSDINLLAYTITPTSISGLAGVMPATVNFQAIIIPPPSPTGVRPRYQDTAAPAAPWLVIAPCRTNLLFPFAANVAGFDTGIAIANTSKDPFGAAGATAQSGSCTLNGFPSSGGAAVSATTPSVASGATFTTVLSSASNPAFNGFSGYIIAVCNFQFGHGFAFITDKFGVSAPTTAQGYVALIIPDPNIQPGGRAANNSNFAFGQSGEGLTQ